MIQKVSTEQARSLFPAITDDLGFILNILKQYHSAIQSFHGSLLFTFTLPYLNSLSQDLNEQMTISLKVITLLVPALFGFMVLIKHQRIIETKKAIEHSTATEFLDEACKFNRSLKIDLSLTPATLLVASMLYYLNDHEALYGVLFIVAITLTTTPILYVLKRLK